MNVENIRALALRLRRLRHEEHYDQSYWIQKTACGTAACLAGHAVLLAGWRPVIDKDETQTDWCRKDGQEDDISRVAAQVLGLSCDSELFSELPEGDWPSPFAERWEAAKDGTSKERPSRIAADLLDAIADGKVKL